MKPKSPDKSGETNEQLPSYETKSEKDIHPHAHRIFSFIYNPEVKRRPFAKI
jgi:hypothetical protein